MTAPVSIQSRLDAKTGRMIAGLLRFSNETKEYSSGVRRAGKGRNFLSTGDQ